MLPLLHPLSSIYQARVHARVLPKKIRLPQNNQLHLLYPSSRGHHKYPIQQKNLSLLTLHYLLAPIYSTPTFRLHVSFNMLFKHYLTHHHTFPQILKNPLIYSEGAHPITSDGEPPSTSEGAHLNSTLISYQTHSPPANSPHSCHCCCSDRHQYRCQVLSPHSPFRPQ